MVKSGNSARRRWELGVCLACSRGVDTPHPRRPSSSSLQWPPLGCEVTGSIPGGHTSKNLTPSVRLVHRHPHFIVYRRWIRALSQGQFFFQIKRKNYLQYCDFFFSTWFENVMPAGTIAQPVGMWWSKNISNLGYTLVVNRWDNYNRMSNFVAFLIQRPDERFFALKSI